MIGYLKGKILSLEPDIALLEIDSGIGFEVLISGSAYNELLGKDRGELFIYTQVREDAITLYGFDTREEKAIFMKIISVSGIGPKMGMTILSSLTAQEIAKSIALGDIAGLSSVKGLGKKTAERLVLELREQMLKFDTGSDVKSSSTAKAKSVAEISDGDEDAVVALMTLGFTRAESVKAISRARQQGASTVEDIIMAALRGM